MIGNRKDLNNPRSVMSKTQRQLDTMDMKINEKTLRYRIRNDVITISCDIEMN